MHDPIFNLAAPEGAAICDLLAELQNNEEDGWNGGDTVEILTAWFAALGLDVDSPAPDPDLIESLRLTIPGQVLALPHHLTVDGARLFGDGTTVRWTCECCSMTRTGTTTGVTREEDGGPLMQLVRFNPGMEPFTPGDQPKHSPDSWPLFPGHLQQEHGA